MKENEGWTQQTPQGQKLIDSKLWSLDAICCFAGVDIRPSLQQ